MKQLNQIVKDHLSKMKPDELRDVIRDANKQIDYIACSSSPAADSKREELQARIDYCSQLLQLR